MPSRLSKKFDQLTMQKKIVAPSILSADFSRLGEAVQGLESFGADWIHVDVMDGHFVPNLTIGAPVVASLRKQTNLPLDVHLMITQPEKLLESFIQAGADVITLHIESTQELTKCFARLAQAQVLRGITLRPKTPLSEIVPYLEQVDLVLVMTVEPGFGGQTFMADQVSKITELKKIRTERKLNFYIEVDGGVNAQTLTQVQEADVLVAGQFVFSGDQKKNILTLQGL